MKQTSNGIRTKRNKLDLLFATGKEKHSSASEKRAVRRVSIQSLKEKIREAIK